MKRVSHHKGLLHIETDLGIINIRVGLTNMKGQKVESIKVIPDHYHGGKKVMRYGLCNTRLVQCKHKTN